MTWRLPFVKMHGAGNDFIMVQRGDLPAAGLERTQIATLCDRRRGIGADGLIVLDGHQAADFAMLYYNADGGLADMCGNGARCAVAFAHDLGLCGESCRLATGAGEVTGRWQEGRISVVLPAWSDLRLDVPLPGSPFEHHHLVNTGVPHLVVPVADPAGVDLVRWGPILRHHVALGPAGANVDWVASEPSDGVYRLRTYERGVEGETLACGTGASAVAVVLCTLGLARSSVPLLTAGGDRLEVCVQQEGTVRRLELTGPARTVFKGEVEIHE
jgi:diaminopimelate epimerase